MGTLIAVYLAAGFLVGFVLFGWVAVASIRRHGFGDAIRGAARTYAQELPLYWRVPVAGWLFVIGLPLIGAWTTATGHWDPVGAAFVGVVWLLYLALLVWHYRTKRRVEGARARRRSPAQTSRRRA